MESEKEAKERIKIDYEILSRDLISRRITKNGRTTMTNIDFNEVENAKQIVDYEVDIVCFKESKPYYFTGVTRECIEQTAEAAFRFATMTSKDGTIAGDIVVKSVIGSYDMEIAIEKVTQIEHYSRIYLIAVLREKQ